MLQSRTGTGWQRPSERPGEWLAYSKTLLTQSVTDGLPTDSARFWLTTHVPWELNLTLDLLTGAVAWDYPLQIQHASSIHSVRKPYRLPTRHMTGTVCENSPNLSVDSMHVLTSVRAWDCGYVRKGAGGGGGGAFWWKKGRSMLILWYRYGCLSCFAIAICFRVPSFLTFTHKYDMVRAIFSEGTSVDIFKMISSNS